MLRKIVILIVALMVIAGVALGGHAVLAQEAEDATVPEFVPGEHMWGWQQDGEQPAVPQGPGHMWGWQQDGERPFAPGVHGAPMMGGLLEGDTLLDIVADTLGLTLDEVLAELRQGVSIAELAESHGADLDAIVAAFGEAHAAALQEAVDAGQLSQEQADWMQQNMEAMIAARVAQPWGAGPGFGPGGCHNDGTESPAGGPRFGPHGRGGMRGGWGGGWQQAPAAPQGPGA